MTVDGTLTVVADLSKYVTVSYGNTSILGDFFVAFKLKKL
jgi:hypothetical protein